jgi:hypothetical protein
MHKLFFYQNLIQMPRWHRMPRIVNPTLNNSMSAFCQRFRLVKMLGGTSFVIEPDVSPSPSLAFSCGAWPAIDF